MSKKQRERQQLKRLDNLFLDLQEELASGDMPAPARPVEEQGFSDLATRILVPPPALEDAALQPLAAAQEEAQPDATIPQPPAQQSDDQRTAANLDEERNNGGQPAAPAQAKSVTPSRFAALLQGNLAALQSTPQAEAFILPQDFPLQDADAGLTTLLEAGSVEQLLELLDSDPNRQWSEDERLLVEQIAGQLSLALENARLFQHNEELLQVTRIRNEELTIINSIISTASQSLDLNETLNEILPQVLGALDFQSGLVSLVNPATRSLELAIQQDLPLALVKRLEEKGLDGTLCDLVYRRAEVINIANFHEDAPLDLSSLLTMGLRSYLGIPLESRGEVVGTMCLFGNTIHTTRDLNIPLMRAIGQQVGVAVENARLFEETRLQTDHLSVLNEMGRALSGSLDLDSVFQNILHFTSQLVKTSNFFIAVYDAAGQMVSFPLVLEKGKRVEIPDHPLGNSLTDYVIRTRQPLLLNDSAEDTLAQLGIEAIVFGEETVSWLGIPMTSGEEVIGILAVQDAKDNAFTQREQNLLTAVARQAAIAIQNARLFSDNNRLLGISRRRADQLQTAAEIARDASSTLALDRLLNRAANLICEDFGYYHVAIFLMDESGEMLSIRAATGMGGDEMKRSGFKIAAASKTILGHVAQQGEMLVINDVAQDALHKPNPLLPETRAEVALPLKSGARVTGALDVHASAVGAFAAEEIAVLKILADQIAVAVENARSYEVSLQAVDEMRKADQLKSQFLANMSHELRTPLNSIIGFSRVILKGIDGPVTELQQQDLSAIYNSGQHLLNLINDILDLSKIEAGKLELAFEEDVNLADLIQSVVPTIQGLIKDKPVKLERLIAPDLPPLRADPLKIRQVLINLLSNAAKFTEQGAITVKVQAWTGAQGREEVIVRVSDTGAGISPEDRSKLFLPFSQVDGSATRKSGGSGLGLSICRHLIEMHGGEIGLESEIGMGSTFYFTLPVSQPEGAPKKISTSPLPQTPLILSVDDEWPILQLYERYLRNHGYQVYSLNDPDMAFETAKRLQPAAITLDIMMPSRDGWQVLEDLKSAPETQNIPVILCSILEEQDKGRSLGASGYLTKPILEEDLIQAIQRLNGSRQVG